MIFQPKISIITVVYNDYMNIEKTILSVINQSYKNIEYIIIDGGSQDGTVDVIKKYRQHLYYWCTEPDKGIFNAMNKGIMKATGDWVSFINSGDYYYNNAVFYSIFNTTITNVDVIYGDMILKYSFVSFLSKPLDLNQFDQLFPFSHPASIVKLDIMKSYLFDERYKLAADYNFFYNLYIHEHRFCYIPLVISVFEAENGASSSNNLRTYKEVSTINHRIEKKKWKLSFLLLNWKNRIRVVIHKMSPGVYKQYIIKSLSKRRNIYLLNEKNPVL